MASIESQAVFALSPTYPSNHAATIVECEPGRFLCAWFGGTHEGHPDVSIWLAHFDGRVWSEPARVVAEPGVALWNPVLFRDVRGVVWLFYKVGPAVSAWTGCYIQTQDGGQTWSAPTMLPAGLLGPAKNKPITLSNGDILCGTSVEAWRNWAAWVEISSDGGLSWARYGPITAPGHGSAATDQIVSATWDRQAQQLHLPQGFCGVIQPTVWEYARGCVKMLLRSTQRVGSICVSYSEDYGRTWSPVEPTCVPNPNSGIDAVRVQDGRIICACNPTRDGRSPLSLLMSDDNGDTWKWRKDLETGAGEYSYPSIIQATDGRLHVVYTRLRMQIWHVVLDANEIAEC